MPAERVSARTRRPLRPFGRGRVMVAAVAVIAAACGGDGGTAPVQEGIAVAAPEQVVEANAAVLASRPGEGINAAGGTLRAGEPCPAPGTPGAAETVKIALSTPDVFDVEIIGLENLVYDDPVHIVDAYVNKVNSFGGINGNCFEFVGHAYGFADPAADIGRICTELPAEAPLVLLGLGLGAPILGCATLGAQIPTLGLYAQFPKATFAQTAGLLRVDHGATEFLLENGMEAAFESGVLTAADQVGLLYLDSDNASSERAAFDATSARLGLQVADSAGVPPDFSGTAVLVLEQRFRDVGGEIFDPDAGAFDRALAATPVEVAGLMSAIRQHFLETAARMREAGVTAVVASAAWDDVRNLMRAAELQRWYPTWIINDSHYAFLVLTDAPKAQGLNLVQVSSRRAADDPIDGRDRGCLSLRNAETAAEPFAHRFHTDAWSLMTSICDYLDVVFSAVSRVDGPLTRESFLDALAQTDYEAAHGQSVRFGSGDLYGSDSFRVLSADPDCVLNDWGCMRSLTGWLEPSTAVGRGSGTEG